MSRCLLCLVLLGLNAGCSQHSVDSASFFPLTPGLQWTYRVTTESIGRREQSRLREYNAEPQVLNGIAYAVRVTDQGTRYFIRETADGVFRAAKRTIVELAPQLDESPRWILKRPFEIGSNWSQETHPYVLRRLHPYEDNLAKGLRFKMAYQIGALSDAVEVPAGRFENCIRVDGEAQISIYADGRTGYQDIRINTSEWYAPGVGLVKLERSEPLDGEVFAGGRMLLELEHFEH